MVLMVLINAIQRPNQTSTLQLLPQDQELKFGYDWEYEEWMTGHQLMEGEVVWVEWTLEFMEPEVIKGYVAMHADDIQLRLWRVALETGVDRIF
jgi:hypothetical protein